MKSYPSFKVRSCPFCGSSKRSALFELRPEQFCSVNWTYSGSYRELLDIPNDIIFPVDRCSSCGFIYSRFLPGTDFLACVYEKVISRKGCIEGSENKLSYARRMRYVATLLEMLPQKGTLRALDFGCGLGISLKLLSAAGVETVGFDTSEARSAYSGNAGHVMANNEDDLRSHGPYDIVLCDNVLEHVPDPSRTVALLASLCREGSLLFISVPDYEKEFISKQIDAIKKGLPVDMTLNPWEHLNYFDLFHLDKLMKEQRFFSIEACELTGLVDVGLRPELSSMRRLKNSIASAFRLIGYAAFGATKRSVTNTFYRFQGTQT